MTQQTQISQTVGQLSPVTGDAASAQAAIDAVMAEVGADYDDQEVVDALMAEVDKLTQTDTETV